MTVDRLTVSQLAGMVGTSADTLRYYERIGLMAEPDRSAAGYRLYRTEDAERVRFIKRAQRFGLRLDDITELLAVRDQGLCPCGGTRRLLEARVTELDLELASLSRLRRDIRAMIDGSEVADPGSECGPLCFSENGDIDGAVPRSTTRTLNEKRARSVMTMTQQTCGCASTVTNAIAPAEPCSCGCCAPSTIPSERIAELRELRASLDRELAELEQR